MKDDKKNKVNLPVSSKHKMAVKEHRNTVKKSVKNSERLVKEELKKPPSERKTMRPIKKYEYDEFTPKKYGR